MNDISHDKEIILITGSSGRIGTAIIDALRHRFQIVGFDRDGQPQPPPEVECVCVDITDDSSVDRGLGRLRYAYGNRIASVIHLAAYYNFSGKESDKYEKVTVQGTLRLLRALQTFDVGQFIFSSTMLVHEPTEPGVPITEKSPLHPKWAYPESKTQTEKIIRENRGGIPAVILRIAGMYSDWCDSIPISHQIDRIARRKITAHVYPGDTSRGQSFIHVDDLVDALVSTVEHRNELDGETTLLIGEDQTYAYDRLQKTIAHLLHDEAEWKTQEISKGAAQAGAWLQNNIPGLEEPFIKPWMIDMADDHYELDISKARTTIDWRPRRRLIDTLPEMIRHLKEEPNRWYDRNGLDYSDDDLDDIRELPRQPTTQTPRQTVGQS